MAKPSEEENPQVAISQKKHGEGQIQLGADTTAYDSGYTLKEIGDHFGLHYAQISHVVQRMRDAKHKTPVTCRQDSV